MAKAEDSFHAFVRELFAPMGQVTVKRMFGGAGGYADGLMFLLIADDTIYLKADDALKRELEAIGCGPFLWVPESGPRRGEQLPLGYWKLPDDALDDPDLAAEWGRKALAVAKRKAAEKRKPAKKAVRAKKVVATKATKKVAPKKKR